MSALGPWQVAMLERAQLRPYYITRQCGDSHWEQLRDEDGSVARFETEAEATAAIPTKGTS